MSRKATSRRAAQSTPAIPRDLLLAGIGAVSLGRKQAITSYTNVVSSAYSLRDQATAAVGLAGKRVRGLRNQAKARVAPVAGKALALIEQIRNQAEVQLQPVLGKLGLATPAKAVRTKRKPAAATRKPAKRARKAA